ncbi:MAG: 3-methyladenine glycosylase, partial [Gemmatimonadetes bacterium]|nr:3-methyladenine glycosylase [Gemmatimonadota bacterium]
ERRGVTRDRDLTNGPAKLCEALGITGAMNGLPLWKPPVEILRGEPVADSLVQVTPRIGITKSAEWPLRWLVKDNAYVSKTPKHLRPG